MLDQSIFLPGMDTLIPPDSETNCTYNNYKYWVLIFCPLFIFKIFERFRDHAKKESFDTFVRFNKEGSNGNLRPSFHPYFIIFTGNCTATLNSYCQPSATTCLSLCLVELVHRRRRRKATCASPRKFMSCSRCSTKC